MPIRGNTRLVYINTNHDLEVRTRNAVGTIFGDQAGTTFGKSYLITDPNIYQGDGRFSDFIPKVLWRGKIRYDIYCVAKQKHVYVMRYTAISTKKNIPILDPAIPLYFSADGPITPCDPNNGFIYLFYQRGGLLYYACYKDEDNKQVFIDKPVNVNGSQISASWSVSITTTGQAAFQRYICWATSGASGLVDPLSYATLTFPRDNSSNPDVTITNKVGIPADHPYFDRPIYSPSIIYKKSKRGGEYLRIFYCANPNVVSGPGKGMKLRCYVINIAAGTGDWIPDGSYPVLTEAADGSGTAIYQITATAPTAFSNFYEEGKDRTDVYLVDPLTRRVKVLLVDTDDLRTGIKGVTPSGVNKYFWVSEHSLLKPPGLGTTGYVSEFNMAVSVDSGTELV